MAERQLRLSRRHSANRFLQLRRCRDRRQSEGLGGDSLLAPAVAAKCLFWLSCHPCRPGSVRREPQTPGSATWRQLVSLSPAIATGFARDTLFLRRRLKLQTFRRRSQLTRNLILAIANGRTNNEIGAISLRAITPKAHGPHRREPGCIGHARLGGGPDLERTGLL